MAVPNVHLIWFSGLMAMEEKKFPPKDIRVLLVTVALWSLFLAAAVNYFWETLGRYLKTQLLFICAVTLVAHIWGSRHVVRARKVYVVAALLLLIAFSCALRGLLAFTISVTDPEVSFRQRVEQMLDRRYRLYTNPLSPVVPSGIYASVRRFFGCPFEPELLDTSHKYQRIEATCFDVEGAAVRQMRLS